MTVFVVGSANRKVDLSVVSSKGNFHFALANIDLIVVQKASKNGKDAHFHKIYRGSCLEDENKINSSSILCPCMSKIIHRQP